MGKDRRHRMSWRPRSLRMRQLLAASVGLVAFLALAGYALDRAFVDVASQGQRERLRVFSEFYAGTIEFARDNTLIPPEYPPDERFERPGGNLYAAVVMEDVEWYSGSAQGPQLPELDMLEGGQQRIDGPLPMTDSAGLPGEVVRYGRGFVLVREMGGTETETPFTVYIMEDAGTLPSQVQVFRQALWRYLGVSGLILLLLQTGVLRWSLWPLRRVIDELTRVQRGRLNRMGELHPRELQPLTESINALIESERQNLEHQRNTMSDLAHSLKTPLAVLRTRLDDGTDDDAGLREEVETQLQRMNDLVGYQLGRGASSGHKLFAAPVEIEPNAEQIVRGLEKIYAAKGVICEFDLDPEAQFHGEPGDLQELLGNLLENAFKWAHSRVLLTTRPGASAANRRPGLVLMVEDNGDGIPADRIALVLQRGVRGDERVQGHGIGLAIVQDIIESYRGELKVGPSEELGGAKFEVVLPPGL